MGKPVDFRNYQLTADFQSFAVSFADFLRHKKSVPAPEETEFEPAEALIAKWVEAVDVITNKDDHALKN